MIQDPTVLEELKNSWNGVMRLRDRVHRALISSATLPNSFTIFIADAAHNLPFVQAFGVLNHALHYMAKDKDFDYKGISLGRLMEASLGRIRWINYGLVSEGKKLRDGVAHQGEIVPRAECRKYIDVIEAELVGWRLLDEPKE
jgi:hypothetical protein